jgi:hypothetical protein
MKGVSKHLCSVLCYLKFLHHVGKRESALFFLLASVFSRRVFHCRGFNEVDEDHWAITYVW